MAQRVAMSSPPQAPSNVASWKTTFDPEGHRNRSGPFYKPRSQAWKPRDALGIIALQDLVDTPDHPRDASVPFHKVALYPLRTRSISSKPGRVRVAKLSRLGWARPQAHSLPAWLVQNGYLGPMNIAQSFGWNVEP